MGDDGGLSTGDWESIIHAPFHVYHLVASADGEPIEAQFRQFREEIAAGQSWFRDGSVGFTMLEALSANLDVLWVGYRAAGRSGHDGIKRAMKSLRKTPHDEALAVRDWLLVLAVGIARAEHIMGEGPISNQEADAIKDLSGWLDRPLPDGALAD